MPAMPSFANETDLPLTLTLAAVSKRYGRGKREVWAIRDISLTVPSGIFGLLGRNGAGKTTLLQILTTLMPVTEGDVRVGSYNARQHRWIIRRFMGYLPQEVGFYPTLSAEETLRYLGTLSGLPNLTRAVDRALDAVNLREVAQRRVGALSGGMRRRLGLAQALLGDPPILVIDEPTAGLDPLEQQRFRALIGALGADRNRTVILSTHIVADIATAAQQVAVLEKGALRFCGSVNALAIHARDQAWACHLSPEKLDAIQHDERFHITAATPLSDGNLMAHIVGPQPTPDALPRVPTLEDGYVALVHEGYSDVRME